MISWKRELCSLNCYDYTKLYDKYIYFITSLTGPKDIFLQHKKESSKSQEKIIWRVTEEEILEIHNYTIGQDFQHL